MSPVPTAVPASRAAAIPCESRVNVQARTAAQAFEAVLIGQLTNMMMTSAADAGDFSGGHGEEVFRGVLAEKMGTEIAKRGGLGLAPAVMNEIITLQAGKAS